MLPSWPT
ncbi:hypothetical protein NXF25_006899 [Crotalus adamanteus]